MRGVTGKSRSPAHFALRRCLRAAAVVLAGAAAICVAWGDSPTFHARVAGPILYKGQSYPAGRIELVGVGNGELLSLRLDSRSVALIFRHELGRQRAGDAPAFLFRSTSRGFELVDICWAGEVPRPHVEVLTVVRAQPGRAPA